MSETRLAVVLIATLSACQPRPDPLPGSASAAATPSAGPVPDAGEPSITADYDRTQPQWADTSPLRGATITCDFRVFSTGDAEDGQPSLSLSRSKEPFVITFQKVNTKKPVMKANLGEAALEKVSDTGDEITLVEMNGSGNVFVYTISRSLRMAIWSKAYFMFGTKPFASQSVGRCY